MRRNERKPAEHEEDGEISLDYCRACFDVGVCEGRKPGSATCDEQAGWRNFPSNWGEG